MSHYKPYPAYRESGVEWIGRVPAHWETLRIKRAAQLRNERRNDSPKGWTYVGLEDVESESGKYEPTVGTSRQSEDSMVGVFRAGDVLYGKLRPYLRKAIVAEQDGVCSTEFLVLSEGRGKSPWVHRWLLTQEVTQQIEAGCDGAKMPRADWEHVGSIPMPLPPASEQTAIAAALDRETARIDALIAKKTRFIELLKEKRQALITHAVTKGLDPNVKMKASGVEWIGEVPEGWSLTRLKFVSPSLTVGIVVNPSEYIASEGLPFIYGGDISEGDIDFDKCRRISEKHSLANSKTQLNAGDLVMVRVGYPGVTAVVPPECEGGNCASVMLIRKGCFVSEWLCFILNSRCVRYQIEVVQYGAAQEQFNIGHAVNFVIPVPPPGQQRLLASHLRGMDDRFKRLVESTEHSVALLKERRSALITAAVTGQIDLREESWT